MEVNSTKHTYVATKGGNKAKDKLIHVPAGSYMADLKRADGRFQRYQEARKTRHSNLATAPSLMTMTDQEIGALAKGLNVEPGDVENFRILVDGADKNCDLTAVYRFVDGWIKKPAELQVSKVVEKLVNSHVEGLRDVCITLRQTPEGQIPEGENNVGWPERTGIVLNAASPTLIGKSGVARAIQVGTKGLKDENGKSFKKQQSDHKADHGNFLGTVQTGDAFLSELVAPNGGALVIASVSGPNVKDDYLPGTGVKIKFASHDNNGPTETERMQLRASYRTFFASIDAYNARASAEGKQPISNITMVTLSSGVFGYPKPEAAQIMLEETLRYLSEHPEMAKAVTILNAFDDVLATEIRTRLESLGEGRSIYLEQQPKAPSVSSSAMLSQMKSQNSKVAPPGSSPQ